MKRLSPHFDPDCPLADIPPYVDGELSAERERELDIHFAVCRICLDELNFQKEFISVLSSGLRTGDELELPRDFTRIVVAKAESGVSGLRRRVEWLNALFICVGLFFFVLFGLGADAQNAFGSFLGIFQQAAAVLGFAGHVVYDVAVGSMIIFRSISSLVASSSLGPILVIGLFLIFIFGSSRLILRQNRSKDIRI